MNLYLVFWVELWPEFEDENLSEKFSAEIEFCKIGPRAIMHGRRLFRDTISISDDNVDRWWTGDS
jgi:hypothetical protein